MHKHSCHSATKHLHTVVTIIDFKADGWIKQQRLKQQINDVNARLPGVCL